MNETKPLAQAGLPIRRVRVRSTLDASIDFLASGDDMSIGAALGNDLRIEDPTVSRFHAQLSRRGDRIAVRDLGSTNGIDFDGARVDNRRIEEGDTYYLCDYELKFTYK